MKAMVVDIAPQQQLTEVFTTNRSHHRSSSSSSSSSTHRRSSTTTNNTSSLASNNTNNNNNNNNNPNNTMTNGQRFLADELGKKAEQILGHATAILDCRRQRSMDFSTQYPFRLNITESKPTISSRSNNTSNTTFSTNVNNLSTITSSQSFNTSTLDISNGKNKRLITDAHLVPLILQLVAAPKFTKLPEMISRRRSNPKPINNHIENREMTYDFYGESAVKLSDDENEEDDDDNINSINPVFTEITDNKTNNNTNNSNSINQINSNDNHPLLPHRYENQIEPQHSGISNSRCQEDEDSEDEDSDTQEAVHSDAENDDGTNETNPHTLSLMDFIRGKDIHSEPVDSSLKDSPESITNSTKKRSISPEVERDNNNHVHNSDDHQNKRQKLLTKRALLKSFISSVNTKINLKRPSLPITIPTHLFFDQSSSSEPNKQEDDLSNERSSQRTSKRYANGLVKHDINTDINDNLSQISLSSTFSLNNNQTNSINVQHQKKNKTSHQQDKIISKQDSTIVPKNEQIINSNNHNNNNNNNISLNDTDNKNSTALLTATVNPIITSQPKKEKPTANVKPLQQSTPIDNLSANNSINNSINISDSLTTTNARAMLPSTKANYTKLKSMSKSDLATTARKKKKQADIGKRTTFAEVREAMSLYLESVCYFIQCANEETKQDQRTSLLTTTLTMLQQLAQNYKKMFQITNSNQTGDLYSLQQKFLLINYWLQSFIYHLQYNTHMPNIERYAHQVTEYFNQLKNPSSMASSSTKINNQAHHQHSTPNNDTNPVSPLSTASQTSASDVSTTSGNNQNDQHRYIYDFSKLMLNSYNSTYYWNKAESLMREKSLKEFIEQLLKQNQNRRLSRDDTTLDFILYIFDSIELLRLSVA